MGRRDNVVRGQFRRRRWRVRRIEHQPDLLKFWPEARPTPMWKRYAPLYLGAMLVGGAYGSGLFDDAFRNRAQAIAAEARATSEGAAVEPPPAVPIRATFGLCHSGGGTNCVVDGDTIWLDGDNIRIADIDAPETHEPSCAAEQALGDRATERLHQLVNSGAVTLSPIDRDQDGYGRKLRIVNVDGTSVGETLVGEGLARWYAGGRRSWCA